MIVRSTVPVVTSGACRGSQGSSERRLSPWSCVQYAIHVCLKLRIGVYGAFDNNAIESVQGPSVVKGRLERAQVAGVKRSLKRAGKDWVES
jgi:hypothetical protein